MSNTPNDLPRQDVLRAGKARIVAYARDANGHAHAMAFIEAECPADELKKIMHTVETLAEHGERALASKRFRFEVEGLFAIKGWQARVACFRDGSVWFLTHGFIKKTDPWPPAEIARALRIMVEHMQRTKKKKR